MQLLTFGFTPGSTFYIKKKALFGNLYHIMINNFSLVLRGNDLQLIEIKRV
jgi:Fe2+ transport system protein FeoA